jgi:hypothetical protein
MAAMALTLPALRAGPFPLPPSAGEGLFDVAGRTTLARA